MVSFNEKKKLFLDKVLISKGLKVDQKIINDLKKSNINSISIVENSLSGHFISSHRIDAKTGKIF